MSRIRSVHPGIWTDEAFVSLSAFARLMFMGIWTEADDKGCFPWSPLQMKMRVLPADNTDAGELMAELEAADCIRKYEIDGKKFGAVRNFAKFQRPKKPNDIHPATPQILEYAGHGKEAKAEEPKEVPNQLPTGGEKPPQMEDGGGKEVIPPTPRKRGDRGAKIPEDWEPPAKTDLPTETLALASQWTDASYRTEAAAFRDYWLGESSARARKSDWNRAWYNRIAQIHSKVMRDQKFGNAPTDAPKSTAKPMTPTEQAAFYRRIGRDDEADEIERRERRTRSTGPPRSIGEIVRKAANG